MRLAALGAEERASVVERYTLASQTAQWHRAETQLGMVIEQAGRRDAQEALGGPLMQLLQSANRSDSGEESLDPIAEPALAALLALVVHDIAPHLIDPLYTPFRDIIPLNSIRD